jgi:imidazolonepropionase-like amidohydrolase
MSNQLRLKAGLVLAGPTLQSIKDGAILIEGGRIAEIGEDSGVPCPEGCERYDLGAATLMPGMIDAHMHTFGVDSTPASPPPVALARRSGRTSGVRSTMGWPKGRG